MIDPDKIYHHTLEAANAWAQADAEARRLWKLEKVVLAEITNQQDQSLTFAVRKSLALASPEYKLHITHMVNARTEANIANARYKAAIALSDNRRTVEASRRAEMGLK